LTVDEVALRLDKNQSRTGRPAMPVLDAKALKTDPEGAAFLLSVLRRNSSPVAKTVLKPNPVQSRQGKPAEEVLQANPSGVTV
jgi:hypothetical protein